MLEIGCSHGRFIKELSVLGYDVVGLELDKGVCNWARYRTGCDIRCGNLNSLQSEEFDVVFANDVIEHIYNPKEFIHGIMKILKPGDKALFKTYYMITGRIAQLTCCGLFSIRFYTARGQLSCWKVLCRYS